MTSLQARPSPSDCSGPYPIGWRRACRGFIYALLVLPLLAGQGFAQGGLQGRYPGNGLEVTFRKDQAEITYAGHLCISHLKGHVEKRSTDWFIVAENCEVTHSLGHDGFHGKDHWLRVLRNGRELAAQTGANLRVVELFALIHDSQREHEGDDPDHGHRAADYARSLQGVWFDLSSDELELLDYACRYNSDGFTEADLTVQVCWDADRLDLGRVGVRSDPRYLCTEYAKTDPVIETAYETSLRKRFW